MRGPYQRDREIVICSAVKATDGSIFRGHRHHDCFRTIQGVPNKEVSRHPKDQGFITSRNRFVTREEAYKLQIAAGVKSASIDRKGYRGEKLYSEDLY